MQEEGDTLWLAGGVPQRWIAPGHKIEVRDAPTYFGPLSYQIRSTDSAITATVNLPTRNVCRTAWLVLRVPDGRVIRSVEIDGAPWQDFAAAVQRIRLPLKTAPMQIVVRF